SDDASVDEASDEQTVARSNLALTVPTTPAGLAALTAFVCEQEERYGAAGPYFCDEEEAQAYAQSLNLAVTGMTGLKPWAGIEAVEPTKPDRIYALIEEHRRLYKAHGDGIDAHAAYEYSGDSAKESALD